MVPKAEVLHALQCLYSSAFLTMKAIFRWNKKKKKKKKKKYRPLELVIYTRANPNRGFTQGVGLRDSL